MTTQFQINNKSTDIYEFEYYVVHMISELNSKRNDGWVDGHYRDELTLCGTIIDDNLQRISKSLKEEQTIDWVKGYEYEKLIELRKKIDEIQRS